MIVYAGTDPLTGRALRHRQTAKTEKQAQIVLGGLLEQAEVGRRPDSRVRVAELLKRYLEVADLDISTLETYQGYLRRTILPALGSMEVRKVRGPILDTFYTRLRRCGNVACTGQPFTEHGRFPLLVIEPGGRRAAWLQVVRAIRDAVASGRLQPDEQLPSMRELAERYELRLSTVRQAMKALADEGLVVSHHGRPAVVADRPSQASQPGLPATVATQTGRAVRAVRPGEVGHDCARSGCVRHKCRPMSPATIRQIHSILSGAFATAVRWEWIDRNPAASAKRPKPRPRPPSSPTPETVAKVIATARDLRQDLLALYLWLAAVTGARRGELCGLQWADVDLDGGIVHVAYSYLVRAGLKLRKDTKTRQDRYLAIDQITITVLTERWLQVQERLDQFGVNLPRTAYIFSSDPVGTKPWNPDWVTHRVAEVAEAAGVSLNIKSLRHYSASQLLAGGIDLRNTAARLGHGGGGATTIRHYAAPVSEVDRRAAAYMAQLTSTSARIGDRG